MCTTGHPHHLLIAARPAAVNSHKNVGPPCSNLHHLSRALHKLSKPDDDYDGRSIAKQTLGVGTRDKETRQLSPRAAFTFTFYEPRKHLMTDTQIPFSKRFLLFSGKVTIFVHVIGFVRNKKRKLMPNNFYAITLFLRVYSADFSIEVWG